MRGIPMDISIYTALYGTAYEKWNSLLAAAGLSPEGMPERIALAYDGDRLAATGAREGSILKLIAVDPDYQGSDLTASVISALRKDAFMAGIRHLFLYTKPKNRAIFSSLLFHPIAETDKVLLLEDKAGGIDAHIASVRVNTSGTVGSIVMNCNPFTRGHRALVERAAAECDSVYLFLLSEDKSEFSYKDRLAMVKAGVGDLKNVTVAPTGPYLISSATFPTYFLRDRDSAPVAQCELDIEIFINHFARPLGITRRYIGSEPLSPLTEKYNEALIEKLPRAGIECVVLQRVCSGGEPISASAARKYIKEGNTEALRRLLPDTTTDYLKTIGLI